MKSKYFHIILSLLLTIAVTDYIWIELFEDHKVVAELEIEKEKEKELEEELREKTNSETKHSFLDVNWFYSSNSALSKAPSNSNFFKHGNSFCPLVFSNPPKLYILHGQLRLHS
ncbi:MAG: hypothetical protein ABJO02_19835 [Reichenbachiella sp.]|uniref:hypothetical protein n=1 Tax=Reichenbachiella sp. TaxID=2184521 RepID=UPI0032988A9B